MHYCYTLRDLCPFHVLLLIELGCSAFVMSLCRHLFVLHGTPFQSRPDRTFEVSAIDVVMYNILYEF